jgi:hypothetical protein
MSRCTPLVIPSTILPQQSELLLVSERDLCKWVGQACIGDTLIYHCGSLAHDRSRIASRLPPREIAELSRVATRALALAEAGLAELAQRRFGPGEYEYRITVRPRPSGDKSALANLSRSECSVKRPQAAGRRQY